MTPEQRQDFIDNLSRGGMHHATATQLVDMLSNLQAQIDALTPPTKGKTKCA
jgi:hypothetical protein